MMDIGLTLLEELLINTAISCAIGGFVIIVFMYFYFKKIDNEVDVLYVKFKELEDRRNKE